MDDSSIPSAASDHPRAEPQGAAVELDWQVLDAYLAGRATPDQQMQVDRWIGESEKNGRFIEVLRDPVTHDMVCADIEVRWAQFRRQLPAESETERDVSRLHQHVGIPSLRGARDRKEFRVRNLWRAGQKAEVFSAQTLRRWAWSLGSVATLVATFFIVRIGSSPPVGTTRSYTTGVNQQGIVTLDDGTRVTLAPQTTLWLRGFSTRNRTVSVDGKAYFDVVHAAGAPFEVRSGSVTARVLGTAFLVDHAPHGSRIRVAVEEGKVRVFSTVRANVGVTVTAGQVGEVTDSTTPVYSVVDSASRTEWFHGQLVFYHMPVATVLQALSRWYGYQFRCADSTLPQRNVTIGVSVRSSASAFATLEQILGVNLTMTGDTVMLTPQVGGGVKGTRGVRSYDVWIPTREVGR